MAKRAAHESAGQAGHEAASRKVLRKASPGPSAAEGASSFGDALQKVLQRKAPRGQGAEVGRSAKGNERLKKRIREEKEAREEKKILIEKRKWFQKEHKIPDAAEGNHEKLLLKLATKGVVKLFNVIQQQQMARNEEKGRAEKAPKPDKMTKSSFLSMLKSGGQISGDKAGETESALAEETQHAQESQVDHEDGEDESEYDEESEEEIEEEDEEDEY